MSNNAVNVLDVDDREIEKSNDIKLTEEFKDSSDSPNGVDVMMFPPSESRRLSGDMDEITEEGEHCHHGEADDHGKQKYFFANWIDIIYMFDMRMFESNLFLQAMANPHGSELAQPEDALYVIDKCM